MGQRLSSNGHEQTKAVQPVEQTLVQSVEPPAAKASKETQCTSDMQLLQPDSQPEIQSQISGDLDSPRTVPVAAESDWLSLPYGIQDLVLLEKFHLDLVGAGLFMLPQRIMKERRRLLSNPIPGIDLWSHEDNLRHFHITMEGPPDTPFEGGVFKLEMFLPETYPMHPPQVRFLTKVYHPQIDSLGRIFCLCFLRDCWSPVMGVRFILHSVLQRLATPEDYGDNQAARHWRQDKEEAEQIAREWTSLYAKPEDAKGHILHATPYLQFCQTLSKQWREQWIYHVNIASRHLKRYC